MDALILTCGTGGGHNSAAKAVEEELKARGHNAVLLNPYTLKSEQLADTINNVYIGIAQKAPHIFGLMYRIGSVVSMLPLPSPVYYANKLMAPVMKSYLETHHYDVIFMTHIFPAEILTDLKRRGFPLPGTVFIATDYTCIPFMKEIRCDAYVVPSEKLIPEYIRHGVPRDRLYPLGIPVSRDFENPLPKEKAKRLLGLSEDKHYILVSGGSIGAGNIKSVLRILYRQCRKDADTDIIAICGSHSDLARKLREKYQEKAIIIKHTDAMSAYMSACDLFLTKPGGLSSTEAAVIGVPIVHISPIPGCENKNLRFFRKTGMALSAPRPKRELRRTVRKAKQERVCRDMICCQRQTVSKEAASDICSLAERMTSEGRESPEQPETAV